MAHPLWASLGFSRFLGLSGTLWASLDLFLASLGLFELRSARTIRLVQVQVQLRRHRSTSFPTDMVIGFDRGSRPTFFYSPGFLFFVLGFLGVPRVVLGFSLVSPGYPADLHAFARAFPVCFLALARLSAGLPLES